MVIQRLKSFTRVVALAVTVAFALATPGDITAHGALKHSAPAANAKLDVAPVDLRLTFNEAPVLAFTKLSLTGPAGDVRLGVLRIDSLHTVVGLVEGALVPGRYTVAWQIAGKDGHPVRDSYAFSILPGARGLVAAAAVAPGDSTHGEAATAVLAPGEDTLQTEHHLPAARTFDASSPGFTLIRFLTYVALLGVIGAVAFRFVVLPRYRMLTGGDAANARGSAEPGAIALDAASRAARIGFGAACLLAVAALFRLGAQALAVHGGLGDIGPDVIGGMLTDTMWGWGWLLQAALSVVAIFAFLVARRGPTGAVGWQVARPVVVILAFTPALAGHAIASAHLPAAAVLSDGLHVIAASGWLGSLAMLLFAGIPAALSLSADVRERAVADFVNAFSPTALAFAALLVVTGIFASWIQLGALSDLWRTEYGKALLWKLGVLSLVVATGAYNWLRVRPSLGDERGTARIKRSARVEIGVAAVVLLITAVLVATPTPGEQRDDPAGSAVAPSASAGP